MTFVARPDELGVACVASRVEIATANASSNSLRLFIGLRERSVTLPVERSLALMILAKRNDIPPALRIKLRLGRRLRLE